MKRFLSTVIAVICGAVIGWTVCWHASTPTKRAAPPSNPTSAAAKPSPPPPLPTRENQGYQPIEEAKICYHNLDAHYSRLDPQLREYLKARLYSASSNYVNEGWLDGWDIDFGPVDDSVLSPVYAIKNASPTDEVYKAALRRHPRSANKNKNAEQAASSNGDKPSN